MAQGTATAQLTSLIKNRLDAMDRIHREAAERTIEVMQTPEQQGGALPFKTGFLRASMQVALGEANFVVRQAPKGGGAFAYDPGATSLVISAADISDKIAAAYTAAYARRMNYGFHGVDAAGRTYNQAGRQFVGLAAQRYPAIVSAVVGEVNRAAHGYGERR